MKTKHCLWMGLFLTIFLLSFSCSTRESASRTTAASVNNAVNSFVYDGTFENDVQDREWQLEELAGDGYTTRITRTHDLFDFEQIYSLTFADGRVSGIGAPNRFSAPMAPGDDNSLQIGLVLATLMAGIVEPEELKEYDFFPFLSEVERWEIKNERLILHTRDKNEKELLMIFVLKNQN